MHAELQAGEQLVDSDGNPYLASAGVRYPVPIMFTILGDDDLNTHLHFQVQIDAADDFSDPTIDVESKTSQTDWYYSDGSVWQSQPSGGVLAYYEYEQDGYGQWILTAQEYTGYEARYDVPSGLVFGTYYYVRFRQWDVEGDTDGSWHLLTPFTA